MIKPILTFITLVILLFSCKEEIEAPYFGYTYFGLEQGRFLEYEVTHITHNENLNPQHDTTVYRLRTRVGEIIEDNQGRNAHAFYREVYNPVFQEFQNLDLWTTIIDDGRAELVEENERRIKLVFAISNSKEWDANAFNTQEELDCYYDQIHQPKTINGYTFDSTLVVEQADFLSLIDYKRKYEVYANGIGLVNLYFKDLQINNFDTLDISKGTEKYYRLLNYGKE